MNPTEPLRTGLRIRLVTPAPRRSRNGNRVTALRWARVFRSLGHRVSVRQPDSEPGSDRDDLLVALHAERSAGAIRRFHEARPDAPIVVALTGTDVYGERFARPGSAAARSLAIADRLVALQPLAALRVPASERDKVRVIRQSAPRFAGAAEPSSSRFDVAVIGHLRPVKDPFRAALAARELPADSRVRIVHVGGAGDAAMREAAESERERNPRYVWLGERPRREALRVLAGSRLAVVSSLSEGGANVISEAAVAGVPILASRVDGNVGLLGGDYPGLFPAGDTAALARLLRRAETEPEFLDRLRERVARLAPLFEFERERESWRALLAEIAGRSPAA